MYLSWNANIERTIEVLEEASQKIASLDTNQIPYLRILVDIFGGNYRLAMTRLASIPSEAFDTQFYFVPKSQLRGQIYGLMGEKKREQEQYVTSRNYLENKISVEPDDSRLFSALGIAYAGLGLKEKAIQEALKGVEILPVSKEFWRGINRVQDLARVYVMVREYDKALDKIEYLLSIPGELSIPLLKIDPVWAPLHSLPRFQKLLKR
jgi:tetratricopeptide (TPR) repeat protein